MLRAVIFDFDGVIADSELLHYKALNAVFNLHGVDISKEVHWQKYLGYTDLENIEAVNRDCNMHLSNSQIAALMHRKAEIFAELVSQEDPIIPGVTEFVSMLVKHNIRRAICSGALHIDIQQMLSGSELKKAFEIIVAADDVSKGKPDPEGYWLAIEKLNKDETDPIRPSECIVIEDSHWGLAAAAAAGMHTIAVTNTYSKEELIEKADKVVDRLDHLSRSDLTNICEN